MQSFQRSDLNRRFDRITRLSSSSPFEKSHQIDLCRKSSASSCASSYRQLQVSEPQLTSGLRRWLQRNIQDSGLQSTLNSYLADGGLSRTDMISVFQNVEDGGIVDQIEFGDLKDIIDNGSVVMRNSIRVLADKVVNGNFANRNYRRNSLGNLTVNSSAAHLEKLVNKWFFGGDRPVAESDWNSTTYRYQYANQPLFKNGISYQDIKQGATGDCYFLAGLAATALHNPNQIRSMFTDNGDGSYTVRFYQRNGKADYVTVDSFLPVYSWGDPVYADYSDELWVALAEKAYAQLNESGWIGHTRDGWDFRPDDADTNSYEGISGGLPDEATEQITGKRMDYNLIRQANSSSIVKAFQSGEFVSFGSKYSTSPKVVSGHAYTLVDYNSTTRQFTLYNPWGEDGSRGKQDSNSKDGKVQLTWKELEENFYSWHTNSGSSSQQLV